MDSDKQDRAQMLHRTRTQVFLTSSPFKHSAVCLPIRLLSFFPLAHDAFVCPSECLSLYTPVCSDHIAHLLCALLEL